MLGITAYLEPQHNSSCELKVKRSLFIADLSVCHDDGEARAFINVITAQHRDANHHCRAYVLSNGTEYSSDDGEPSGTAGKPILNAIKRAELVNVCVVVTRYFGGVKLGVRGLIDAYGQAADMAIELAGRVSRTVCESFFVLMNYDALGLVQKVLDIVDASGFAWEYGQHVSLKADVPIDKTEYLTHELTELKARNIIIDWSIPA